MLRQLRFGLTDLKLHTEFNGKTVDDVFALQRQVVALTDVLPYLPNDFGLCTFQHIFAGGYACGYYSYKWAEVLSADAFQVFLDRGVDDKAKVQATGETFRKTILSLGGALHPAEVFRRFKGADPDPDSLLKQQELL